MTERAKHPTRRRRRAGAPRGSLAQAPILLVGADAGSVASLREILAGAGAEVRVARDGEQAGAHLDGFRPRVVVVNLVLPGASALVLAERLERDPRTAGVPLVAVNSLGPEAEQSALRAGFAACVPEPVHAEAFLALVARLSAQKVQG